MAWIGLGLKLDAVVASDGAGMRIAFEPDEIGNAPGAGNASQVRASCLPCQ